MVVTESLAARAEAMLNRLGQAEAEAASQQARTEVEVARVRATRVTSDLRAAAEAIPTLEACGIVVGPAASGPLLKEAVRARAALRTAATSMVGAPPIEVAGRARTHSVEISLASAEKLAKSVLNSLNRYVDQWRRDNLPERIDEPVISPGSDHLVVRLRNLQRRLERTVDSLTAGDLVQRAQEIKDDAAAWIAERPQLDADLERRHPEVREFLRQAATEEGAPLYLITPVVATWLKDAENSLDLRVVLRS
jgi:hypothetical protein